jgi:hypothetical protein
MIPEAKTTALETEDGRHAEKMRRAAQVCEELSFLYPHDRLVVLEEETDGDYTSRLLGRPEDIA